MTKIKKRYGKHGGYLPHCVDRDIKRRIKKEEANNPEYYIRVDDKFFILNEALGNDIFKIMGFIFYGVLLFGTIIRLLNNKEISYLFTSIFFSISTFFIIIRTQKKN